MINKHDLAESESSILALAEKHPSAKEWMMNEAEIIRNARRYLALRKVGVQVPGYDFVKFDRSLDAAADRLLEGGE